MCAYDHFSTPQKAVQTVEELNPKIVAARAADISARTPAQKTRILQAARAAGFNHLGIYDTFIHLDCNLGKRGDVVWGDPFKT